MRIFEKKGIFIKNENFAVLDASAKHKAEYSIISHAHNDHVYINGCKNIFTTQQTADLIKQSGKVFNPKIVEFDKKYEIGDVEFEFSSAGHVLGSSQLIINDDNRIVCTSDFKLEQSIIEKPAEIKQADVLITESTFGLPHFSFPKREETYAEMESWIKRRLHENKLVILAGYQIGKAQELTAFVNKYLGISPLVYDSIYSTNKIYENHGIKLGNYIKLAHNLNDSQILIMPPHYVTSSLLQALHFSSKKKIAAAKATGWAYHGPYDRIFPLSDHADFNQLMHYIEESKPKLVLTTHGYAKELAHSIVHKFKIPAYPLAELAV